MTAQPLRLSCRKGPPSNAIGWRPLSTSLQDMHIQCACLVSLYYFWTVQNQFRSPNKSPAAANTCVSYKFSHRPVLQYGASDWVQLWPLVRQCGFQVEPLSAVDGHCTNLQLNTHAVATEQHCRQQTPTQQHPILYSHID